MQSTDYLPGEWYVIVTCHHCHEEFSLFHDLTKGKAKLKATYSWTCPGCDEKDDYNAAELKRYQHPMCGSASNSC